MDHYQIIGTTYLCGALILFLLAMMLYYADASKRSKLRAYCHGVEYVTHILIALAVGWVYLVIIA